MRSPRIFYHTYSHNRPTGGQKHTYEHVDVLNQIGFDAYAFHDRENFRLTWFENDTRVIGPSQLQLLFDKRRDILVYPEDLGSRMLQQAGRKIIFNKNAFYGFMAVDGCDARANPYLDPEVTAVLAVSEHNRQQLQFAYPKLPVHRVWAHIDQRLFAFRRASEKERVIAYTAKSRPMLLAIRALFTSRALAGLNSGAQWRWEEISGVDETAVAAILARAAIFVFPSVEEGLPRMPLEAMSCGCVVTAFRCGPLAEILPVSSGVEYGDLAAMVRSIETIVDAFPQPPQWLGALAENGRAIAGRYSRRHQEETVGVAWERILADLAAAARHVACG